VGIRTLSHESTLMARPQDESRRHDTSVLGMWVFLVTELMLFGALFTLYASYRYFYPDAFIQGSLRLNLFIATANTAVLIISSLMMALAVRSAQLARRRMSALYLALTAALGLLFLGLKAVEYYQHFVDKLVPGISFAYAGANAPQVQLFYLLYFALTGVHAIHLAIGITLVALLGLRLWLRPAGLSSTTVEIVGLYWHFVDVIWLFLFPLLYLVTRHV
jgi:cytochrome c oxidase subunit 3